ncbi:MAG: efflux RND transporter periplasmic adaptor subunit [candidate division WWE3 bacterium]|nr:efflux RND transporter periplasmic adaptor subunit [candidate division WWE3 bacterium]
MIKKIFKVKNILIVIVALAIVFIAFKTVSAKNKPLKVTTATVKTGSVQKTLAVSGFIKAENEANLSYGATGSRVTRIQVKVGDTVATGSALMAVDPTALFADVTAAKAAVAQAEASYNSAKSGQIIIKETYNNPKYDGSARIQALKDQSYDAARSADDGLTRAQAALDSANYNLNRSVLISPINGVVTKINSKIGEIPGGVAITVTDLNSLYYDVLVDQADIATVKNGQNINIEFKSNPGIKISGIIYDIAPSTAKDSSNNTVIEVKAKVMAPANITLRPGVDGDADIIIEEHANTLKVPFEAIVENGTTHVWRVINGQAEKVAVTKGLEGILDTEIVSGLKEGDTIILNPAKTLVNGQKVAAN